MPVPRPKVIFNGPRVAHGLDLVAKAHGQVGRGVEEVVLRDVRSDREIPGLRVTLRLRLRLRLRRHGKDLALGLW